MRIRHAVLNIGTTAPIALWLALCLLPPGAVGAAKAKKDSSSSSLEQYLAHLPVAPPPPPAASAGSLWVPGSAFTQLARDYKSHSVGDVVMIVISESTVAQDSKTVDAERSFSASSGIEALAGHVSTSGVMEIFSPQSAQALTGKGQSASNTQLQTSIAGQVVAVVSGGMLVIQARHEISMNQEKQTITVRGIARPGDIGPNNAVASTSLANLEVEINGKGVLSDANRQPNWLVRTILKVVGF